MLFVLAGIVLVGARDLVPRSRRRSSRPRRSDRPGPQVYDPYAGGYPVPPLPGQVLPAVAAQAARSRGRAAADADEPTTPQVTQEVHGG